MAVINDKVTCMSLSKNVVSPVPSGRKAAKEKCQANKRKNQGVVVSVVVVCALSK